MSRANIETLQSAFERIHGMLIQFTEVCPDDIWREKFGGFPVWQQAFHSFACYDFFVRNTEKAPTALLFGEKEGDVAQFKDAPFVPTQADVRAAAEKGKALVDAFFAALKDDAELVQACEGASARMSAPFSNLALANILVGHGYYHLGSCDAALRQHGKAGIF